jgi:HK97 family phage portal protein
LTDNEKTRTELLSKASKAFIQDRGLTTGFGSRQSSDFTVVPDTNLSRVLEVVQNDPVVRGAVTTLVDRTLEPGYGFYAKDKRSRREAAEELMESLKFELLLPSLLQHIFTYSNAFIEVVRAGDEPRELHMLDPRYLEIQADKHGEILRYVMEVNENTATWGPDEVVHLKTTPLGNMVWGDVDIKALWTACALKHHIKKLMLWQFETNQFRPLLNIQNASDEQIKRFLTFLREAQHDIKRLVPIEGEVEAHFINKEMDYSKLKELMAYLDYEILNLLQVPPISVGLPGDSNRSNADAQERAFNTRIRSIQRLLENIISIELMPKLGYEKVYLRFNVTDEKVMMETLEMAERMHNMGIKEELIKEFLESKGWDFPEGTIFDPEAKVQKSMDQYASRQGKGPREANDKKGTGDRAETREDQLVSRAEMMKEYWTYDVEIDDALED